MANPACWEKHRSLSFLHLALLPDAAWQIHSCVPTRVRRGPVQLVTRNQSQVILRDEQALHLNGEARFCHHQQQKQGSEENGKREGKGPPSFLVSI